MDQRIVEYVEWSPQFEVGLPLIDDQHRKLFELAATFKGNGDQIRVMKTLAMLVDYVKTHLREEEALMADCQYPRLAEHQQLHGEFKGKLYNLLENAKNMSLDAIADEVKFLINGWFCRHILAVDVDYAPYLKAASEKRLSTTATNE